MIGRKKSNETKIKLSEKLARKQNKEQSRYRSFPGHVRYIFKSISDYANDWGIPIADKNEFISWAVMDSNYTQLHKLWEESGWSKQESPVIIRNVKLKGYVLDNIYWARKGNYSWWNGELEYLKQLSKDMAKRQTKNNETTTEEQEEMKQRLKKVRK